MNEDATRDEMMVRVTYKGHDCSCRRTSIITTTATEPEMSKYLGTTTLFGGIATITLVSMLGNYIQEALTAAGL